MDSAPAAPAPAGYHVNMQNPQVKDVEIGLWISIVGVVVATFFLVLRVYTRPLLTRMFGVEDICILLSWALTMSVQALFICE